MPGRWSVVGVTVIGGLSLVGGQWFFTTPRGKAASLKSLADVS